MLIKTASDKHLQRRSGTWLTLLCLSALAAGCSSSHNSRYSQSQDSAPAALIDVSGVKDAVPRAEPRSRYGNPASYNVLGKRYHTLTSSKGYTERGIASWYGTKFHGHRTSSGDTYDMYGMSAAHKSLPLPTYARVTNLRNGKSVIVKINDRGPFHDNRLIDLSYAAASRLEILDTGTGLVEIEAIDPQQQKAEKSIAGAKKPVRKILASKPKISGQLQPDQAAPALYLQVGAFQSRSNAERLQNQLRASELPGTPHISEGVSNQQRIYRVRIGPLETPESADHLSQTLIEQGIPSPRVVID